MTPVRDVSVSARGTTDAAGSVTLSLPGPHRPLSRWNLTSLVVTSDATGSALPTAKVYRSIIARSSLLGTSRSADAVTFETDGDYLQPADSLFIVIEGAEPGTVAVANLYAIESDHR